MERSSEVGCMGAVALLLVTVEQARRRDAGPQRFEMPSIPDEKPVQGHGSPLGCSLGLPLPRLNLTTPPVRSKRPMLVTSQRMSGMSMNQVSMAEAEEEEEAREEARAGR
jgi:hypothetical protein